MATAELCEFLVFTTWFSISDADHLKLISHQLVFIFSHVWSGIFVFCFSFHQSQMASPNHCAQANTPWMCDVNFVRCNYHVCNLFRWLCVSQIKSRWVERKKKLFPLQKFTKSCGRVVKPYVYRERLANCISGKVPTYTHWIILNHLLWIFQQSMQKSFERENNLPLQKRL